MVGYTRLIGLDEDGTIARQRALRHSIVDPELAKNAGRVVKTTGDGLLVEFGSAVDAVRCAISVQELVARHEEELPADRRIRYRVGINLGDVVVEGDDLLGDGVNVAARLEGIAEPGGICISDAVYRSVEARVEARFENLGEQSVKNIAAPVRTWKWIRDVDGGPADDEGLAKGGAEAGKPSIAVLPFTNMSGDSEQEYFADGMAEDIITELSKMPWFFVVARNSTFTYKGRAVDVKAVGAELGVSYVLEGSVRKAGSRLRINAQLIDARTGNHVWADRFDRQIADIFDIQDEITQAIIGAVSPEFVSAEIRKSQHKDPKQLDAWECVMRGRSLVWKLGREEAVEARKLFEQAIELSPGDQLGLSDLALVHFLDAFYEWSDSREISLERMVSTARRAVAVDEGDPLALTILAWAYLFARNWDEALVTIDQAIAISPNFAPAIGIRGTILACSDEPDLAITAVGNAIRRSPRDGFMPYWLMGQFWACHSMQNYREAEAVARQAIRAAPNNPTFRRQLVVALHQLGRADECRLALAEYRRVVPGATADDAANIPARNRQHLDRYVKILEEAGLPRRS